MLKFKWETKFNKMQIWTIPEEWNEARLGDFVHLKSGKYFQFSEFVESGVRCLKIDNVGFGEVVWNTITFLPEDHASKHPELILNEGDMVIALNRPIIDGRIKVGKLKKEDSPSILYQRVGKIVFDKKGLNDRYLFFIFLSETFKRQLSVSLVGTDQPYVRTPIFLNLKIPYPPFIEQLRIASVLSWFDDLIENKKRQNEILEKTAMAIFKSWFIDFEPFKDSEFVDSELGKIPKGWKAEKLGEFASVESGGLAPQDEKYFENGSYPFVRVKHLTDDPCVAGYDLVNEQAIKDHNLKKFKIGDVVFPKSGEAIKSGKVNILPFDAYVVNHLVVISKGLDYVGFIYCYVKTAYEELLERESGTTLPYIKISDIRDMSIIVPPEGVIEEFNSIVNPLFRKIILNQKQIMVLGKVRDVLLPLLVFGRLRVEEI